MPRWKVLDLFQDYFLHPFNSFPAPESIRPKKQKDGHKGKWKNLFHAPWKVMVEVSTG
jgi:hypothetical protein